MGETGELVLAYSRHNKRRRNWHVGLRCGLAVAAGLVIWKFGGAISHWTSRRRLVLQTYRAQQRCLQTRSNNFPPVTITNSADRGQALGFTDGGSSADLSDFVIADAGVTPNSRPFASSKGRSVLAVRAVVRPDGTHRLMSVETEGASIATYVWSVGSPITPARLMGRQIFALVLPPHRPFMLASAGTTPSGGTVSIRAGFTDTTDAAAGGGTVEFVLGNDDRIRLNAPFGWGPPEMPDVWAPAGRPRSWPESIRPSVMSLPFAGRSIGFQDNSTLVIADDTGCTRINLITGKMLGRSDFGKIATDGVTSAIVSPDGRRVMVTTNQPGWFVLDPLTGEVLSTHDCGSPQEAVRTGAFSADSSRLVVGNENRTEAYDSTGYRQLLIPYLQAGFIAAGTHDCVISGQSSVEHFGWTDTSKAKPLGVEEQGGSASLSNTEHLLLISSGNQIGAYDFPTGRELFHRRSCDDISDRFIRCRPAFFDHDQWVVIGGEKLGLYLIDLPRGEKNLRIDGVPNPVDMAVSSDGQTLAVLTPNDLKLIKTASIESAVDALPSTAVKASPIHLSRE